MPYWSSSRVGIQPQPDSTNNNKSNKNHGGKSRSERFSSRQKGITMEDLKKQTALRLAEEQSRQRGGGGSRQPRCNHHNNRSSSGASAATASAAQQQPNNPQSSRGAATVPPIATQPQPQPPQQPQREAYPVERGTTRGGQPQPRTGPPPPSAAAPHPYLSASVSPYHKNPHSVSAVPVPQAPHAVVNHANNNPAALNHSASFSIAETASTVSSSSAGTHHSASTKPSSNANASNKSKLPHGLTVQELKEMTKARLQAEAASSQGPAASGASAGVSGVAAASAPPPPQENVAASAAAASIPPPSQLNRTSSRGAAPSPLASFAPPQDWQASEWDRTGLAAPSVDYTNRPRAVTLSPRFALLEEEPPARERALSSSEMALPPLRPASSDQQQPLYPMTGNRDRTSSAASLPPMSETAQEFGLGTSAALPPPFGSVSEEPAEAVEPSSAANASSYLSDVFRTALFDSTESSADEPRIRAATWSEPLFGSCGTADALPYTELASILKLSGASEQTEEQGDNDICEDVL